MALSCGNCGDPECSICDGRPSGSKDTPLDDFLQRKAQAASFPTPGAGTLKVGAPVVPAEPPPKKPPYTQREHEIAALGGITLPDRKVSKPRVPKNPAFAAAYVAWQEQCVLRKNWIEQFREEMRDRISKRAAAVAGWDRYVEEARLQVEQACATPVPIAPRKEDFPDAK